jgi:Asp-tRNA(Asn)/Glu-tRNA(Gln) amidotransferase A subunit family amidase
MRVSISDTISIKGTHTTFSSRAWKSLYKEASSNTAKYAQTLLDQGAVIIGKTKTSQFGTGAEWIDQQAPWSARGDGYNSMKGGSVGAAAALVGYPWLDHSIGVDGKSRSYQRAMADTSQTAESYLRPGSIPLVNLQTYQPIM